MTPLSKKLRNAILWSLLLVLSVTLGQATDWAKAPFVDLLPLSIGALDRSWWYAFVLTMSTALCAWLVAVGIGYSTGLLAAELRLSGREGRVREMLGSSLDGIYAALYVIPFVLTASSGYTLLFRLTNTDQPLRWLRWAGLVAIAAAALGGYKIFSSVYSAVAHAKDDTQALISALYAEGVGSSKHFARLRHKFRIASRYVDAEILMLGRALSEAFHLSLVAIMIVEVVVPNFYENLFPQTGPFTSALGGVGYKIMKAQAALSTREIAGILWLVIILDYLIVTLIDLVAHKRWTRYYKDSPRETTA